jgi:CubicO group peptidase (beta-lactamase class C family)
VKTTIAGVLLIVSQATSAVGQGGQGGGLPHARPEDAGLSPDSLEWIAPALRTYVESGKLPGILAIIARHGKTVYVNSIGTPTQPGPQESAVFRIFSMTKPITTAGAMQLIERGRLRLDDPVSKYIPSFANVKVFAGGSAAQPELRAPARAITVADLLTHTSGLTYGLFDSTSVDSIYRGAGFFGPGWTTSKLADSLARLPLVFSPGEKWNYGFSIDVLGRVIEIVSGTTLDRFLDSSLFKPLRMTMTGFRATPAMLARVIPIYLRGPDGKLHAQTPLLTPDYTTPGELLSGGGGLLSTPDDYLRFAQMLLNGGELDGKRVLKRETVALMMQNHVPDSWVPALATGARSGWIPIRALPDRRARSGGPVTARRSSGSIRRPISSVWCGRSTCRSWSSGRWTANSRNACMPLWWATAGRPDGLTAGNFERP